MRDKFSDEAHVEPRAQAATVRDPIYLFSCHIEWHKHRNIRAYAELVAALDDTNENIRHLAESLLHRSSPRPMPKGASRTSLEHP
jgi:hypothetical protein